MSIDDFIKQAEEDDERDRIAEQELAAPIEYARSRNIAPQKVYKSLRTGKLEWAQCACGRRVIVIAEADELYGFKQEVEDAGNDAGSDGDSEGDQV